MSRPSLRKAVIVGATVAVAASLSLGATNTAFADAPTSSYSTSVGFMVPGQAQVGATGFDIKGGFWGLRPGESLAGYSVKVTCGDGFSVMSDLTPFGPILSE